jgi:predicted MPP superfamily phosphohydrolase
MNDKNVIITGATGMVGGLALKMCLDSPDVSGVTALGRRATGIAHAKLHDVLVDDFGDLSHVAEAFEAQVFFATGNHEHYVDMDKALDIIAGHRVRILHNEVVLTHGFQLVGLDYMNADENTFDMHAVNKLTIKEELPKIFLDRNLPVVLMHHSPVGLDYVVKAGVDLMLSGHTHAGQMFPATLINNFLFPLNKGLHQIDGTAFFVSQGAGTYGPRIRLGSSNEINLIRLTPKE